MIEKARVWQRRHDGNLIHLYPMILSAERGLDQRLERVDDYHRKAREVAAVLTSLPGLRVVPDPPHTNMMHVFPEGDQERLMAAHQRMVRELGADLFSGLVDTSLADVHRLGLTLGDASLEFTADEVRTFFETLLAYARE